MKIYLAGNIPKGKEEEQRLMPIQGDIRLKD